MNAQTRFEIAARAAGWSPSGPHGKWVLAGDKNCSQGSYMPTERACRYICEDHGLIAAFDEGPDGKLQTVLPGAERVSDATILQRRASAPLRAAKHQRPCDVGLFSDEADQLDLVEMFQDPDDDAF